MINFEKKLFETDWKETETLQNPCDAYTYFLKMTFYWKLQLVDQISNTFENNLFTSGVLIELSKAFDTVDHDIFICKLKSEGIRGNNLKWFESYQNNRKQFTSFKNKNTYFVDIKFGVSQGSILGPLIILIYVNNFN